MSNAKIELSANGTAWTDISGETNTVEPGEQTRQTGVMYTLAGDTAIITAGKREPLEISVKTIYTEVNTEANEVARAIHEAGGVCHLRYSPRGGNTGDAQYTCQGVMSGFTYPSADSGDAKPMMGGFKITTSQLTRAIISA